jgi:hypothetical protein
VVIKELVIKEKQLFEGLELRKDQSLGQVY